MIERRVGEERVGRAVLDRRPLEPEEEELRLEGRALLPQFRNECAAGGLGHVGREKHVRVVESARCDRLDPLALVNRLGELGGGEGCDLAVVAVAEGRRCGFGLGEVGFDLGIINGGVEAGEVPGNVFGTGLLDGCHAWRLDDRRLITCGASAHGREAARRGRRANGARLPLSQRRRQRETGDP